VDAIKRIKNPSGRILFSRKNNVWPKDLF